MEKAKTRKPIRLSQIALALLVIVVIGWGFNLQREFSKARQTTDGLPFRIAKETTFYTEPVDERGGIDYLTIINNRSLKSEKRSDNGAIKLLEALGDGDLGLTYQAEAKWLGVEEKCFVRPPYIDYWHWMRNKSVILTTSQSDAISDERTKAENAPWKPTDYPDIAAWLNEMGPSLDRVSEGANAPHFFLPIIRDKDNPYGEPPYFYSAGKFVATFKMRAQLRLQAEDYRQAWEDVATSYRLIKGCDELDWYPYSLYQLERTNEFANAIMAIAPKESLNWSEIRVLYSELRELSSLQEKYINMRDYALHLVSTYAITNRSPSGVFMIDNPFKNAEGVVPIDWSIVMERINQEFAELDKIFTEPNDIDRVHRLMAFQERIHYDAQSAIRQETGPSAVIDWLTPRKAIENRSQRLASRLTWEIIRCVGNDEVNRVNSKIVMDCQFIASEVHFFKKKSGRYPNDLRELATENQIELPVDPIRNLPYEYQVTSSTVSIYTLGEDGKASSDPNAPDSDVLGARFLIPNVTER